MLDELPSEPSGYEALAAGLGVKSRYSWVLLQHRGQETFNFITRSLLAHPY